MTKQTELLAQASAVLEANRRDGYTAPADGLYPHQWLWDSCFTAIGLRHTDLDRARQEVLSLLDAQWHNGMLPHMIFNPSWEYESDRRAWHSAINPDSPDHVATSGITQPPLLAEVITRIGTKLDPIERRSWYKQTWPALLKYHQWLYRERDPAQTGLVQCVHPWETGMDNTPAWMTLMREHRMPLWIRLIEITHTDGLVGRLRRDLRYVPLAQRYATIDALTMFANQQRLRALGYDSARMLKRGPFQVADLAFNAILIRNNRLLGNIAAIIDRPVPAGLRASFNQAEQALDDLFDEPSGYYYSRNMANGQLMAQPSIATLLPLYAGSISKERARHLVERLLEDENRFGAAYPIPSVPVNDPSFDAERYWQGPSWFNTNWLVMDGLRRYGYKDHAAAIGEIMAELVAEHGFYEYYQPLTGQPLGARGFSWTAAVAIDITSK